MSPAVIIMFALFLGPAEGQQGGCPYKECVCKDWVTIDCSYKGLSALPSRVNPGGTYSVLLLNGNHITTLTANDLLPVSLTTLNLQDNPVTDISNATFLPVAKTLRVIKLRSSKFRTLPSALELLVNLDTLDIEDNMINIQNRNSLVSKLSKSLVTLRLANTGLHFWPEWLETYALLRNLYLDGNHGFTNEPNKALEIARFQLTHLSLSNSSVRTSRGLSMFERLQWLDLSRNELVDAVQLSYDLYPSANTLTFLDLSFNNLTTEPRLEGIRGLSEVNLNSNQISFLSSGAFPSSLVSLNLDNNRFTSIPGIVSTLTQLQSFTARSNKISSVGAHDFPASSKLSSLNLGGNPISSIDDHAFDGLGSHLFYLGLDNTRITRLPLALAPLYRLQTLSMPNNPFLICTCQEKSLYPTLTSRPQLNIVGQCGKVDIKEFVNHLTSSCT